jgi:hypothetical protein
MEDEMADTLMIVSQVFYLIALVYTAYRVVRHCALDRPVVGDQYREFRLTAESAAQVHGAQDLAYYV